jgi:N-glycosylase/DNA lyase
MHRLSQHFSEQSLHLAEEPETVYYPFPASHLLPVKLEDTLRELGFGYRAGFIEASVATLRSDFGDTPGAIEAGLNKWRDTPAGEVRDKLLGLKGVGRKVADCVMLMCLDQVGIKPYIAYD